MLYLNRGEIVRLFNNQLVAKNSYADSDVVDVSMLENWAYGVQWEIDSATNSAVCKFEMNVSNRGDSFLNVLADITSAQSSVTGPGSDGKNMTSFTGMPCKVMKVRCTETANVESARVYAWIYGY